MLSNPGQYPIHVPFTYFEKNPNFASNKIVFVLHAYLITLTYKRDYIQASLEVKKI